MMEAYGKIAKDKTIEAHGPMLRNHAVRRPGELMDQQKRTVGMAHSGQYGGGKRRPDGMPRRSSVGAPPTLAQAGIDKNLAIRARKLAAMPAEEFEAHIEEIQQNILHPPPRAQPSKPHTSHSRWVYEMPGNHTRVVMHAEHAAELLMARTKFGLNKGGDSNKYHRRSALPMKNPRWPKLASIRIWPFDGLAC